MLRLSIKTSLIPGFGTVGVAENAGSHVDKFKACDEIFRDGLSIHQSRYAES